MDNYQNNYESEFEREFEFDDEATVTSDEFELENEFEYEFEAENDSNDEYEIEEEADYLSEFEADDDLEDEFENSSDGRYERRLYEIFSNSYEHEFEFENDFNQVLHEVQRDYFWKKIKKIGKKLAPIAKMALKSVPGGGNIMDGIKQITKDPRGLIKSLAMKFGPQALNAIIPGSGIALGAVLGNNETEDVAKQAARDTIGLARESYSSFADEISRTNFSKNLPEAKAQLRNIAKDSFKKAHRTVSPGSKSRYRRVNRKVESKRNGTYKVVTITYKKV